MAYIRKLDSGKWRAEYRDPAGRKQGATFVTKTQAVEWAADQERDKRKGAHRDPRAARQTLREWHGKWWKARAAAATTEATNESHLRIHVLPAFGDFPLEAISTLDIQAWVKQLGIDGKKSRDPEKGGSPLSAATIRDIFALLSTMLKAAVLDQILARNPCEGVNLPPKGDGVLVYYTEAEMDALVGHLSAPADLMALFMANTGLRWGECAGLHLRNLDLLRKQVTVVDVVTEAGGKLATRPYPKSSCSRRTVPLPTHVAAALSEHVTGGRDALVFSAPRGGPWRRGNFRRELQAAGKAAGLDPLPRGPHDLRHTYASWLAQAGVSLYKIQQLLGHESITTTQRYSHLAPDAGEVARTVLDRPVRQAKSS